jgi:hypothetical protein
MVIEGLVSDVYKDPNQQKKEENIYATLFGGRSFFSFAE